MTIQGRKILILESNVAVSFPLAAALRKCGWILISAQDAAAAMSVARQQKPDAVLLNSKLAGGGGLVALRRLRSSVYTTLIPVICVVPANTADCEALIASGAQETIDPPGDPQAIDAALRRYLERSEAPKVPAVVLGSPERLSALKESRLLDSKPEEALDRVVRLTAKLVDVPIALLSIVDKDRQFFKSQVGLPEPLATTRQTPLSHSFCQWVVGGNEELIVADAREHPVLKSNLAVRDLGVVAYAGVPFATAGTEPLGSFCAVDARPVTWTEDKLDTLRDLSIVTRAYVVHGLDGPIESKIAAAGAAISRATQVLLRGGPHCGEEERKELGRIIEEQSARLSELTEATVSRA